jgi:hypothetical protein
MNALDCCAWLGRHDHQRLGATFLVNREACALFCLIHRGAAHLASAHFSLSQFLHPRRPAPPNGSRHDLGAICHPILDRRGLRRCCPTRQIGAPSLRAATSLTTSVPDILALRYLSPSTGTKVFRLRAFGSRTKYEKRRHSRDAPFPSATLSLFVQLQLGCVPSISFLLATLCGKCSELSGWY